MSVVSFQPKLSVEELISLLYLDTRPDLSDIPARHRMRLISLGLARREGTRLVPTQVGRAVATRQVAPARVA